MIDTLIYFTRRRRLIDDLGISIHKIPKPELDYLSYSSDELSIFLVYDQVETAYFRDKIWPEIHKKIKDEFAIIHHSYPRADSGVIAFLKEHTAHIRKGSHQRGNMGYHYYLPLRNLISQKPLPSMEFEAIRSEFQSANNIEEILEKLHQLWHQIDFSSTNYKQKFNELIHIRDTELKKLIS